MRKKIKIEANENNIRLDKFLSNNSEYSRTKIQSWISEGLVSVNSKKVTSPKLNIELEDIVEFTPIVENIQTDVEPIKMDLDIRYEDEYLLVVNKDSGVVVHPGAGTTEPTLVNGLVYYLKNNLSRNDDIRPGIVHRLDKDTSGLLVIAKNDEVHNKLQTMIQERDVKRHYRAIVKGEMEHKRGTIDAPIMRDPKYRQKFVVGDKNSKDAITNFETQRNLKNDLSLVNIQLQTGRTHQIRVHFKYIDHPVFNDPIYGKIDFKEEPEYGQFLQAYKLIFDHPVNGKEIKVELELPREFNEVINS